MLLRFLFSLVLLLGAFPALAQAPHLKPSLVAESGVPVEGGTVEIAIAFAAEPGWHGYWLNPGDAGLPISVEWDLPDGASVAPLSFPTPQRYEAAGLINHVYKGDHALLTRLTVPATGGLPVRIAADMRWLACTDTVCVPERGRVELAIPIGGDGANGAPFDEWRAKLPRPLDAGARHSAGGEIVSIALPVPAGLDVGVPELFLAEDGVIDFAAPQAFRRTGDWLIADLVRRGEGELPSALSGVVRLDDGTGLEFRSAPGTVPAGGTAIASGDDAFDTRTLLLALGGALLGGLLLNLMPCVFPILTVKALHLARSGGDEASAKREALGYTAGAVLGTAVLGLALILLREGGSAVGWAFQLQDPRTIFVLLLLAGAITYNLLGLFELPVLGGAVQARSSVATGALAAFVATPCAGPFLGAAIGAALVLPPAVGVGVFAMLGLGLALPFLALGFVPALRRRLPKPGPWMERLKRWLAIPMALTVAACLWLLWRLAGSEGLAAGLAALAALGLVLALLARRSGWLAFGGALAVATAGLVLLPAQAIEREASVAGAEPWSEAAVAAARAEGRPVFVYFTADWCLTCKANERVAIARDSAREAFEEADVAVFVADWTDGDAAITRFLDARERAAVPLYLWYAPGAEQGEELPQLLTPGMLVERAEGAQASRSS